MTMTRIARTKTKNLFNRGGWYVLRCQMQGRTLWRSLHIEVHPDNYRTAVDAARTMKLQLRADTYGGGIERRRAERPASTIAEIAAAYRAAGIGSSKVSEQTIEDNLGVLNHLLGSVLPEFTDLKEVRADKLTRETAEKFGEFLIAGAKAKAEAAKLDPEATRQAVERRQNSFKSYMTQARSVFKKSLLTSHHYKNLVLPDSLAGFMAFKVEGSSIRKFQPPPAAVWKKIVDGIKTMRKEHPARWFAMQLSLNAGLRRTSAVNAKWAWCTEDPATKGAQMEVRFAKKGAYTIELPPDLWKDWKATRAKPAGEYIIPGADGDARSAVVDEVVAWLRSLGIQDDRPFHYLRKFHGDFVDRKYGIEEAARRLGHKGTAVARASYVEGRSRASVRVV